MTEGKNRSRGHCPKLGLGLLPTQALCQQARTACLLLLAWGPMAATGADHAMGREDEGCMVLVAGELDDHGQAVFPNDLSHAVYLYHINHRGTRFEALGLDQAIHFQGAAALAVLTRGLLGSLDDGGEFIGPDRQERMSHGLAAFHAPVYAWARSCVGTRACTRRLPDSATTMIAP